MLRYAVVILALWGAAVLVIVPQVQDFVQRLPLFGG